MSFVLRLAVIVAAVLLIVEMALPGRILKIFSAQTWTLEQWTGVLATATVILALVTAYTVFYMRESNARQEQLFVGVNRPLIDVTPVGIAQMPVDSGGTQAMTVFNIANYSGFIARNIGIDLKYGDEGTWILEWRRAENDRLRKGNAHGIQIGSLYQSAPERQIEVLAPGGTTETRVQSMAFTGSLDIESICGMVQGMNLYVRVAWQNEHHHSFDEIHKYQIICTKVGEGRSFTFIPKGIVSQKASGSGSASVE